MFSLYYLTNARNLDKEITRRLEEINNSKKDESDIIYDETPSENLGLKKEIEQVTQDGEVTVEARMTLD